MFLMISCTGNSQKISQSDVKFKQLDSVSTWYLIQLKNKKWGFADKDLNIKIPFKYDDVGIFSENKRVFVKENNKFGYYDLNGKIIIPIKYSYAWYFQKNGLAPVCIDKNKCGFIDDNGEEIISVNYNNIKFGQHDNIVAVNENEKWAFFDNKGKQVTDFLFDDVYVGYRKVVNRERDTFFKNGAVLVQKDKKYEFLNEKLEAAFPNNKFDSASVFDTYENAIVKRNGKYGMIKPNGEAKVPIEYDFIDYFDSNHITSEYYNARKGKIYTIFNRDLKKLGESYEPVYNDFSTNTPFVIFKNLNNKYGIAASNGEILIPFEYDELTKIKSSDLFKVSKRGKVGISDNKGTVRIPLKHKRLYQLYDQFDDITLRNKSLFVVDDNSIIDINNNVLISGYSSIEPIFENHNMLIVSQNKKFGIIDINKNTILPLEYDHISNWTEYGPSNSKFIVKNGKTGLINEKTFKVTIPPIYDKFRYLKGLIFAKKKYKSGILTEDGKVLSDFIYDEIYPNASDFYGYTNAEPRIYAKKGNSYFQIDAKGKVLKSGLSRKVVIENSQLPGIIPNQVEEPPPPPKLK